MEIRTENEKAQIAGFYYQAHKRGKITREEGRKLTGYLDQFIKTTSKQRSIRYWYDGFVGVGDSRSGEKVIFLIVGREGGEIKPLAQLTAAKRDVQRISDCFHDYLLRFEKPSKN